jgi:V/A-type H+-transporting ATPase subunit A
VGEEGTSLADYLYYLQAEFLDFVYLQQNAFDPVDEATPEERQVYVYDMICHILESEFIFEDKDTARHFFQQLRQLCRGWNSSPWQGEEFSAIEQEIRGLLAARQQG